MLGKSFSLGEPGVDFHVRRPPEQTVFAGSGCLPPYTCPAPTHHHCSLLPAGQGSSHQWTHTPLPGANKCQERAQSPSHGLYAHPATAPVEWMPQPCRLPISQEKSPKDLHGSLRHKVPRDGSWLMLLCFMRGCSAQK